MIKSEQNISGFPPISVAMATYNGAKYLEEQLDSILVQTLAPADLIVCDDLSTDGTVEILEKYQAEGRLRFYVNDARLGYIGNFKKAVSLANPGHYVALSDQDDVWLPGKIQAAMDTLLGIEDGQKPAMVYSDLILVDEEKKLLNPSFRNELGQDTYEYCLNTLLFGGFVNGCTMLMNPKMAEYFSTIPEGKFFTHDTWIALIAYTFGQVGIVPEPLIHYRRHHHNTSELNSFKKKGRLGRIGAELLSVFNNKEIFERELICVAEFYKTFHKDLEPDQRDLIERFLKMEKKGYLGRKLELRRFFKGKWIRNFPTREIT